MTLLILLDLSAAFDTIDHNILLQTLQTHFGVDGMVLSWIRSYLSGRKQQIMMDGVVSNDFEVPYDVPQGSRLGPLLFTLYTSNLIKAIQKKFSFCFFVTAMQTTHNCTFLSVLIKTRRSRTYQFLRHVFSMFVLGCVKISLSLMIAKQMF